MSTAGRLIWTSLVPLLKMGITITCGYLLTRQGLFPPVAAKGFSQITMNIALPSLIFSSIVPSFNQDNIASIGPLLMTAIFYVAIGTFMAFVVREVFWVPKQFQYGILIMGALSNWGNLPTAIVQSLAAEAPFNPSTDPALGVGYVAVFILVYNVTFFTGLYRVCAWDFIVDPNDPNPNEDRREPFKHKWARRNRWLHHRIRVLRGLEEVVRRKGKEGSVGGDRAELGEAASKGQGSEGGGQGAVGLIVDRDGGKEVEIDKGSLRDRKDRQEEAWDEEETEGVQELGRTVSTTRRSRTNPQSASFTSTSQLSIPMDHLTRQTSAATVESFIPSRTSPDPADLDPDYPLPSSSSPSRKNNSSLPPSKPSKSPSLHTTEPNQPQSSHLNPPPDLAPHPHHSTSTSHSPSFEPPPSRQKVFLASMLNIISLFITPITMSLVTALVIALVSPLKALFVPDVEGWSGTRIKMAPDGRPALAFIQDTATFIGALTVPGALILLGASFARLSVPKPWSKLPLGAIIAMTCTKMIILPVVGVAFVQGLSNHTSLYPKDEKILSFVAMLLSGTPAAVNQLVVTQLVAPEGAANTLAAFLLVQYCFMFISSTALSAVALSFVS